MSNDENEGWKLGAFLREKISRFGLNGQDPEELMDDEGQWDLKNFVQQKLFDFGLTELRPGEEINDRQKWVRKTGRLRGKMFGLGLDDGPLEEIFESEGRKWTFRTYWRVKRFALELRFRRLIEFFERLKSWAPNASIEKLFRNLGLPIPSRRQAVIAGAALLVLPLTMLLMQFGSGTQPATNDSEVVEESVDFEQELAALTNFQPELGKGAIIAQKEIEAQKEKIASLRDKKDLTELNQLKLNQLQLELQRQLVLNFLENGVGADVERLELEKLAVKQQQVGDLAMSQEADFALCSVAAKAFSQKPNKENADIVKGLLSDSKASYLHSEKRSNLLLKLFVQARSRDLDNPVARESLDQLVEILSHSNIAATQKALKESQEFNRFSDFKLYSLEQRIRSFEGSVISDMEGVVELLRSQPNVMLERWILTIRACEAFLSVSDFERYATLNTTLAEIANSLPDSYVDKQRVLKWLERQKDRVRMVGKELDLSGEAAYSGKTLQGIKGYRLIAFAERTGPSIGVLQRLADDDFKTKRLTTIVAFKPGSMPKEPTKFPKLTKNLRIVSEKTAESYFSQYPIDFFPHCVLVGPDGRVVATNLYPMQVEGQIRKARAATLKAGAAKLSGE